MTVRLLYSFNPMFSWIDDELARRSAEHLLRSRRVVTSLGRGRCRVDQEDREFLDFSSNDYLDLATDPRLREAARAAIDELGVGARASALVSGIHPCHERLRRDIAEFEGTNDAILFPTGFAANQGTIAALAGPDDAVFCDRFNHASLVDGCRLSGATLRVYRHDDLNALDRDLDKHREQRRRLIVTDGLFSMDGDLAPLPGLWELAERHRAMLLVDEAHATGVLGEHGRGSVEHFGLDGLPIVRVGTLSKAVGSLGGFVAGPQNLIDLLWNTARTQIYSTGLPPSACAAASAGLRLIRDEPARRRHLLELSELLRRELRQRDLEPLPNACGPIVPIVLDDPERAVRAAEGLQGRGMLVAAIRPPTVPRGTSRLRISLSSGHTADDVHQLVHALSETLRTP